MQHVHQISFLPSHIHSFPSLPPSSTLYSAPLVICSAEQIDVDTALTFGMFDPCYFIHQPSARIPFPSDPSANQSLAQEKKKKKTKPNFNFSRDSAPSRLPRVRGILRALCLPLLPARSQLCAILRRRPMSGEWAPGCSNECLLRRQLLRINAILPCLGLEVSPSVLSSLDPEFEKLAKSLFTRKRFEPISCRQRATSLSCGKDLM